MAFVNEMQLFGSGMTIGNSSVSEVYDMFTMLGEQRICQRVYESISSVDDFVLLV